MYDYIIIGTGFAGSVLAERIANDLNKKVLMLEKRNHIGGNMYDFYDEAGVLTHLYGPHIFHTNLKHVWDYVNQFGIWSNYQHEVLGSLDDKLLPIPFNLNTLHGMYDKEKVDRLEKILIDTYGMEQKVPILELRQSDNIELQELAELVYQKVFLNYTTKQWGLTPEQLDPAVTNRVPVFISRDNRYFQDTYQGLPKQGYTKIFETMLDNEHITVETSVDALTRVKFNDGTIFFDGEEFTGKVIFTGQIEQLFDYKYGELPYRSLHFIFKTLKEDYHYPVGTVNFPNEHDYTRITEFKHITEQELAGVTTIMEEYPQNYDRNIPKQAIPYYPIPTAETDKLYQGYVNEAKMYPNLVLAGRLAQYKYFNMDAIIAESLKLYDEKIK